MKALTLYQPWASLIACGVKTIETRSWATNYRGLIAIHAAKTVPPRWWPQGNALFDRFKDDLRKVGVLVEQGGAMDLQLPYGAIVAVAELWACGEYNPTVGMIELPARDRGPAFVEVPEHDRLTGSFGRGRFGWLLRKVRALDLPIACRGMQGLWTLPDEIEARLGMDRNLRLAAAMPAATPSTDTYRHIGHKRLGEGSHG